MGGVYKRRGLRHTTFPFLCQLTDKQCAIIHRCVCIKGSNVRKVAVWCTVTFPNVDLGSYVKLVMLTLEPHQHTVFEKIRCH